MTKSQRNKRHLQIIKQLMNQYGDPALKTLQRNRLIRDDYKTLMGCEGCGFSSHACALQLDHIDPSTKFRDSKGNLVHPGNMVYQTTQKMITEFAKCRVMCANCHAIYTHTVQRMPRMSVADVRLAA